MSSRELDLIFFLKNFYEYPYVPNIVLNKILLKNDFFHQCRRHFCFAFFLQEGFGFLLTGPFLPCDDLFGWWSLRCGVWIVFLLAVVGNGIVLFVSITARSKLSMDVPRFLICNLACADFMMGAYLGILAILDASTLGMTATLILSTFQSPLTIVKIMIIIVLLWEENPATIFFYKHIRFR